MFITMGQIPQEATLCNATSLFNYVQRRESHTKFDIHMTFIQPPIIPGYAKFATSKLLGIAGARHFAQLQNEQHQTAES